MDTKNPVQVFVTAVEIDLLLEIANNLKESKMTADEAQKLAREFLQALPVRDKEDLLEKLRQLGTEFPQAQDIFLKYTKEDEEQERQQKLQQMALHIKSGNIEKALEVAKA